MQSKAILSKMSDEFNAAVKPRASGRTVSQVAVIGWLGFAILIFLLPHVDLAWNFAVSSVLA